MISYDLMITNQFKEEEFPFSKIQDIFKTEMTVINKQ